MSETTEPYDFRVIHESFLSLVACTSLSDGEAQARVPWAGTSAGWHVSERGFSDTGSPYGECADHPGTHRHILFDCQEGPHRWKCA